MALTRSYAAHPGTMLHSRPSRLNAG